MKSKLIAGMSLAAVFAVFMIVPAMATESWQHVTSSSVTSKNGNTSNLSVTAADQIPRHTGVLGGFAWLYASGSPNTAFVAVTHNGVRDSNQNPDGWHTHNVLLGSAGSNSAACIVEVSPDTNAGLSIKGNTISVNVRNSELTGTLSGAAAAFTIVADNGCASGLGVNLS